MSSGAPSRRRLGISKNPLYHYLTVHWLEHRDLPQERVRELLVELFVGVVTAATTVGAR